MIDDRWTIWKLFVNYRVFVIPKESQKYKISWNGLNARKDRCSSLKSRCSLRSCQELLYRFSKRMFKTCLIPRNYLPYVILKYPSIEKSDEENPVRRIETRKRNNWTIIPREGDIHGIILPLFFKMLNRFQGKINDRVKRSKP